MLNAVRSSSPADGTADDATSQLLAQTTCRLQVDSKIQEESIQGMDGCMRHLRGGGGGGDRAHRVCLEADLDLEIVKRLSIQCSMRFSLLRDSTSIMASGGIRFQGPGKGVGRLF